MGLQTCTAQDLAGIEKALKVDGACVVSDVLPETLCERLLEDFSAYLKDMEWGLDDLGYRNEFYGLQTKRLHGLFSKSTHMVEVLMHPTFLGVARALLVETEVARDIRLSNAELMVLGQDQKEQMFHTDAASWHRAQRLDEQELLISANCALTEFTRTNGATRVVPGSHLWAADRAPREEEICQAIMPRGSALLYTGKVIHSGGANQQATQRVGLYLGYCASWLRPLENHLVTNAPRDIGKLSAEAQQLLDVVTGGFTVFA